jgi:hypothetical protein
MKSTLSISASQSRETIDLRVQKRSIAGTISTVDPGQILGGKVPVLVGGKSWYYG